MFVLYVNVLLSFVLSTCTSATMHHESMVSLSSDLHLRMNAEEILSVFGNSNSVPEYQVVELSQRHLERSGRSLDGHDLEVYLNDNSENPMRLQVRNKSGLVSPNLTVTTLDSDGSARKKRFSEQPDCLYQGTVEGAADSSYVALSTCSPEGMMAVIHMSSEHYMLVPVPKRLRRHRRSGYSNGQQHDHILYRRQETSDHFCSLNTGKHGIHGDLSVEGREDVSQDSSNMDGERVRRQGNDVLEKTIELAVFVDDIYYDIMQRHYPDDAEGAVLDMVFTLVNAVQLIYSQPSLSVQINFVLVHVHILKSAAEGPPKEGGEIKKYLKTFCAWQYELNDYEDGGEHWDHALMLTGLNMFLGEPSNSAVIGLSWVSGMCHTKYSCSINEGTNFESVYVISHELGHNLGMQHDGLDNECHNNTHLMSASLGPGKTTWSTCSDDYLRNYLSNDYASCMDNAVHPSEAIDYRSSHLPGQKYSASRQCHLSFGQKHRPYIIDQTPFDDICRELWCANGTVARRAHPALDGTTCLQNMICFHGKCVSSEEVEDELSINGRLI